MRVGPVIPPGWVQRHKPILDSYLDDHGGKLVIRRPSIMVWDEQTRQETRQPGDLVYQGPGHVQEIRGSETVVPAGTQDVDTANYWGAVPAEVLLEPGLVVTVISDNTDPALIGKTFVITWSDMNSVGLTARHFRAFHNLANPTGA